MDSESVVRLGCHSGKYLWANEDGSSVRQEQNGLSQNSHWTVESFSENVIRFRSCYGKYLTASSEPFESGLAGCKVIQTNKNDVTVLWEIKESSSSPNKVMLRPVCYQSQYLTTDSNSNSQWKNSVTHMELGSGNVWWELEYVNKIPKAHAEVQDLTTSQSLPAQTSRSTVPSQARGSDIVNVLSGANSVANIGFIGYKISKEFHLQEPPAGPTVPTEPTLPTPDDSSNSVLDIIGEIFSGIFG